MISWRVNGIGLILSTKRAGFLAAAVYMIHDILALEEIVVNGIMNGEATGGGAMVANEYFVPVALV